MIFSRFNPLEFRIPEGRAWAVIFSFDVETWPDFCGGVRDSSADPYEEYYIYIPKLLDVLGQYNIKAKFFVCGKALSLYPEVFKRILMEGHEIGGHGYLHEVMSTLPYSEQRRIIYATRKLMLKKFDYELKSWRCPYLMANLETYKALKDEHIIFSSNARCGDPMNVEGIFELPLSKKMDSNILDYRGKKNCDVAKWINYMKMELENLLKGRKKLMIFGMHT